MPKTKARKQSDVPEKMRPALSPEARENQLISLAVDLAEEQLRDGTASAQVVTHFLKLASQKEKLEREKLDSENRLLQAKIEALQSAQRVEEIYSEALRALIIYSGKDQVEYDDEDSDIF